MKSADQTLNLVDLPRRSPDILIEDKGGCSVVRVVRRIPMHRVRKKVSQPVQRTYTGKGLFGKLKGTFVFRPKGKPDKKAQLKLGL